MYKTQGARMEAQAHMEAELQWRSSPQHSQSSIMSPPVTQRPPQGKAESVG